MADVKISGLPASTVPLAGTEVLPIVQSTTTKQVSVANLTAGRAVAALSVTTATVQAPSGSAGGTLNNGSGVAQMQWGSGGGSNLSLEVATNINPANAIVNISPTGTGSVAINPGGTAAISPTGALTINPTAASTMNNVAIGGTTALAGRFTDLSFNSGYGSVATAYGCRAWVNFDGTTNVGGFCTILGSGNVSSITDSNVGLYLVNLTNAMPDVNYSVTIGTTNAASNANSANNITIVSASQIQWQHIEATIPADTNFLCLAVFR
jgi:hypothetical protein